MGLLVEEEGLCVLVNGIGGSEEIPLLHRQTKASRSSGRRRRQRGG